MTNSDKKTLEPFGTLPNMSPELTPPNGKRSLEIIQKTKINKHNRIETALQWKREEPALPHNETPALSQYKSLKKFQKNKTLHCSIASKFMKICRLGMHTS